MYNFLYSMMRFQPCIFDGFYNEEEAKKYVRNSRIRDIQSQMTERAMELLLLPDVIFNKYIFILKNMIKKKNKIKLNENKIR
ncbi:hypothetical protein PFFVO_01116 [Plasmodium falciparum Vietnam Oak-Knoll (FVO)]|uniref:Uncharacterized protein n=1 Tax=Plasmodium falciparum Vietnam Oak-Knoll (FVO) TaxID=1036723 RepID=A0A024VAC3_PLAFA|nr:hypothetical protein PFFVO_01116 [Plasmodium falciparum Vietnam Oak-Knoll (FVO)]